ncbi:hypothetical protein NMY22_g15665 [Coprinellus aureogranulatus]|nr:hypothetical protein NMY22_g15665 [Coprinellus aureogranulatus]
MRVSLLLSLAEGSSCKSFLGTLGNLRPGFHRLATSGLEPPSAGSKAQTNKVAPLPNFGRAQHQHSNHLLRVPALALWLLQPLVHTALGAAASVEGSGEGGERRRGDWGTSINVYGAFAATNGTLSASYTIDSASPQSQVYSLNPSANTQPNHLLFAQSSLTPGLHTLTLTITENTSDAPLSLDYLTYEPSFTSLNSLLSGSTVKEKGKGALSKGALAGIIVGVILGVAILVGFVCVRQMCVGWVRGAVGRKRGAKKLGSMEKGSRGAVDPRMDPWSSQSPHYAFNVPGRKGSEMADTILTFTEISTPISDGELELRKEDEDDDDAGDRDGPQKVKSATLTPPTTRFTPAGVAIG